ncbi:peroxisomal membrane protein 2-like [Haliotis rufescens]|uniref:peroxisomal membrane protein 2-like n=1 Tax=Haliotis rufescens TaxID=6454 RepID=UPI001EB000A2|nr:peroxisomal membrane protein 2-like [Haliotis rufescens]
MSLSKSKEDNPVEKALKAYLKLLQEKPILTKACTSAVVSSLGNIVSQLIVPNPQTKGRIAWRSTLAYATFGFCVSGPVFHYFYVNLEKFFPKGSPNAALKKVLFDRLIFTPPFIFLFLYVVSVLEGQGHAASMHRIRETYWYILKMNWKVWTIIQFINIKYIPVKYRVLFGNAVSLIWSVFISYKRRSMVSS